MNNNNNNNIYFANSHSVTYKCKILKTSILKVQTLITHEVTVLMEGARKDVCVVARIFTD